MLSILKDPSILPPPQIEDMDERQRDVEEIRQRTEEMDMMDLQMQQNQPPMMQDDIDEVCSVVVCFVRSLIQISVC